jgi:hypothetical protein
LSSPCNFRNISIRTNSGHHQYLGGINSCPFPSPTQKISCTSALHKDHNQATLGKIRGRRSPLWGLTTSENHPQRRSPSANSTLTQITTLNQSTLNLPAHSSIDLHMTHLLLQLEYALGCSSCIFKTPGWIPQSLAPPTL